MSNQSTEPVSQERLRNTRAWAASRVDSMSGADVIVSAIDELLDLREQVAEIRKYSIAACSDMGCFCDDAPSEEKCSMCVLGEVIRAFEEPTRD